MRRPRKEWPGRSLAAKNRYSTFREFWRERTCDWAGGDEFILHAAGRTGNLLCLHVRGDIGGECPRGMSDIVAEVVEMPEDLPGGGLKGTLRLRTGQNGGDSPFARVWQLAQLFKDNFGVEPVIDVDTKWVTPR